MKTPRVLIRIVKMKQQDDLDRKWALELNDSLTEEQFEQKLRNTPSTLIEMIVYLPEAASKKRLKQYVDFLLGGESVDNFEAASALFNSIDSRDINLSRLDKALMRDIEKISQCQEKYDADEEIFGSFTDIFNSNIKVNS